MPMKWCALMFVLCSAVVGAQTPSQNAAPNSEPYQAKALENALRRPNATASNSFSGLFATQPLLSAPILTPPMPPASREFANTCAIPLLSVPVNPDMDRSINHELKPDALSADPMPTFKGLPICRQDHQPAR